MTTEAGIKPFREITDDGELRLNLHTGQTRAWVCEKLIICLLCGSGYGKTCFGSEWIKNEMEERGEGDYLAVTANFTMLELKMLPELKMVFETLHKWGTWKAGQRIFESHERLHGAPHQRLIVRSASSPEALESATVKGSWVDEAGQHQFTRQAWEAIQRRGNMYRARVLLTSTPYEFNWLKSDIYDRWRQGDPNIEVIQGDSIENPAFPLEAYERARATLPRWKFNMFMRGQFEKPAGLIYDSFDETVCSIPRFILPANWPRYVGHDFGPQNTAAVWYAQDPGTGYLYVYRTYHEGGLSAYDHAQKFKSLSEGENILKRVGGAQTEDGWRESFTAAGWPISKPREREVEIGINIVYGWHQQNKLFVFNDMHEYLDEKLNYSRVLDESYQPTERIEAKSRYHILDCERYVLCDFGPERAPGSQIAKVVYHGGDNSAREISIFPKYVKRTR